MKITVSFLIIAILMYFSWAFVYHRRDKSLTLPILSEYLLIAALVLILLLGVTTINQ